MRTPTQLSTWPEVARGPFRGPCQRGCYIRVALCGNLKHHMCAVVTDYRLS